MGKQNKYVCIHGHFYQPPRENAWLDQIEIQESAHPFHDWNERINFECYAPNTSARILDSNGLIHKIINNYTYLSYNFGPTLLSWMERKDRETYNAILESDKISKKRFGGHGSAIAQAHSHLILPLANYRDKVTQVKWGLDDFRYRFGRESEGIWLAETAVDTETLEVLADQGLKYTILAPRQAKAFRKIGDNNWTSTNNGFDTRRPYLVNLPSGKSISLFFYDGAIAQGVAFDGLLNDGNRFAERFHKGFDNTDEPQLVHIATDGETYGHHHRHGEMALASCLHKIDTDNVATLTNYGEYLEKFPPTWEIQIHENSSWSCVHGVERWRSDCGCSSGTPGWNQKWRGHLRGGLNWLRDYLEKLYEREAGVLFKDPWEARNDYVHILINRNQSSIDDFFAKHVIRSLNPEELTVAIRLLELQKFAMYMYTSCGWFFDEISGLETNQILQYALRAMQYVRYFSDDNVMETFSGYLKESPSNVYENGSVSYTQHVVPSAVNLERVAMHFAVTSLFENSRGQDAEIHRFRSSMEDYQFREAGNQRLAVGKIRIRSKVTYREKTFRFVVLYLGQQNIIGNIRQDMSETNYIELKEQVLNAFDSTNLGDVLAAMQKYFEDNNFTIWHLFKDEKRKILNKISQKSLNSISSSFREIYNDNYQLMSGMLLSNIPIPNAFTSATDFILNAELHEFFDSEVLDIQKLRHLASEFKKWKLKINNELSFRYAASERIFYEIRKLALSDFSMHQLVLLNDIFEILAELDVKLDIWKSQNLYFGMLTGFKRGDWVFATKEWESHFKELGDHLGVKLELAMNHA